MRTVTAGALAALLTLTTLSTGCGTGSFRDVPLAHDMTPGDVAHYTRLKGATKADDFTGGFPFLFVPLVLRNRTSTVDTSRSNNEVSGFHFEDTRSFGLILANDREVADFDSEGNNLRFESRLRFLLGMLTTTIGHRRDDAQSDHESISGFSIGWGLFGTGSSPAGRWYRVLWLPFGSSKKSEKEVEVES